MPAELVNLKEIARRLLANGDVALVIGYGAGPEPLRARPLFARRPEQADGLVFDRSCENNLVKYLHRVKGVKVALVVKGCDERSVVGLLQEKQVDRSNVVLIGAPCSGVVDPRRVAAAADGEALAEARVEGTAIVARTASGKALSVAADEVLYAGCGECNVRNPRFADFLIGAPAPQPEVPDISQEVAKVEASAGDGRWTVFRREMEKCILCFACRSVCPACYCQTCFTESSQPQWVGKTADPADAMFFHLARLLHLTGRCTGCGACVRACPVHVNLRLYNDRLRKDVKEVFGFEAGLDPAAETPLSCFRADDPNDFIK